MSLLTFWSTQNMNKNQKKNEKVRFIRLIFYPRDKKLSVLNRYPLCSVRFVEVSKVSALEHVRFNHVSLYFTKSYMSDVLRRSEYTAVLSVKYDKLYRG